MNKKGLHLKQLHQFWENVFPWSWLERWATHNGRYNIGQRTFYLTLQHGQHTKHNHIFKTLEDFRRFVLRCDPLTIHMGAIWPSIHDRDVTYEWYNKLGYPCQREVTLDIDLNDYGELRQYLKKCHCGGQKDKSCCDMCWSVWITNVAIPMLNYMLGSSKAWGFKDWHVVFSGRRGIHVWIRDVRVMIWSRSQRQCFLDSLRYPTSCHARYLMEHIYQPAFERFFVTSDVLVTRQDTLWFIFNRCFTEVLPDGHVTLETYQTKSNTCCMADVFKFAQRQLERHVYVCWLHRVICYIIAPRFDEAVTIDPKHLCKLPLVPHASTRNLTHAIKEDWKPSSGTIQFPLLLDQTHMSSHKNALETYDNHNHTHSL